MLLNLYNQIIALLKVHEQASKYKNFLLFILHEKTFVIDIFLGISLVASILNAITIIYDTINVNSIRISKFKHVDGNNGDIIMIVGDMYHTGVGGFGIIFWFIDFIIQIIIKRCNNNRIF